MTVVPILNKPNSKSVIDTAARGGEIKNIPASRPFQDMRSFKVDWAQLTLPEGLRETAVQLVAQETQKQFKPIRVPQEQAYYKGVESGNISVFYENKYRYKNACIVFRGQSRPSEKVLLLLKLLHLGAKFTRIDIAFDDFPGFTSIGQAKKAWISGLVVSRFSKLEVRSSYDRYGGENTSLFFGSRTSETSLRAYHKHYEAPEGKVSKSFLRWELEVKGKTAEKLGEGLKEAFPEDGIENPPPFHAHKVWCWLKEKGLKLLTKRISFKNTSQEKNVTRAKLLPWWKKFIGYLAQPPKFKKEDNVYKMERQDRPCEVKEVGEEERKPFTLKELAEISGDEDDGGWD